MAKCFICGSRYIKKLGSCPLCGNILMKKKKCKIIMSSKPKSLVRTRLCVAERSIYWWKISTIFGKIFGNFGSIIDVVMTNEYHYVAKPRSISEIVSVAYPIETFRIGLSRIKEGKAIKITFNDDSYAIIMPGSVKKTRKYFDMMSHLGPQPENVLSELNEENIYY